MQQQEELQDIGLHNMIQSMQEFAHQQANVPYLPPAAAAASAVLVADLLLPLASVVRICAAFCCTNSRAASLMQTSTAEALRLSLQSQMAAPAVLYR